MGKIWWILFVAAVAFWLMLDKNADDFNYGNKQYYLLFQYYWKMLCLHVIYIMLDTLNFYACNNVLQTQPLSHTGNSVYSKSRGKCSYKLNQTFQIPYLV